MRPGVSAEEPQVHVYDWAAGWLELAPGDGRTAIGQKAEDVGALARGALERGESAALFGGLDPLGRRGEHLEGLVATVAFQMACGEA